MATEPSTETVGACVDSFGSAVGMPQLCGAWFGNQIFWLLIALVAIYFILSRIALPRIAAILAARQGAITTDLSAAEDLKNKAAEAEAAYEKALIDARAEAGRIVEATKADIKADLDAAIAAADQEIAVKSAEGEKAIAVIRDGALEAVNAVAQETAAEIVSAFGAKADGKAITTAVTARMKG